MRTWWAGGESEREGSHELFEGGDYIRIQIPDYKNR